jgi:acetyltransferase-like isoleucine patch superfamily enzyme
MKNYTERGKFNDIHESAQIGKGTIISNFVYIGKDVKIGKNVKISNYVNIDSGCTIGDNTSIQVYSVFNNNTRVGKNCLIAGHVGTVDEKYPTPFTQNVKRQPCEIGDNVIIGEGAKLVSVKIGNYAVVGTGAVVLKDVPFNQVWVGNPAKPVIIKVDEHYRIMTREDFEAKGRSKGLLK